MSKLTNCPNCGCDLEGAADGRATRWRIRVRLYDMHSDSNEPMVDSDPSLEPDQPGDTVVYGLWKVISETYEAVQSWHEEPCVGLDDETRERKERGIRPTLSRNKGRGTIRIEYDTKESFNPSGRTPRYLARCDIVRADGPDFNG